jgi:hypothetical protein
MPERPIEVHVHVHLPGLETVMADLTRLTNEVSENTSAVQSAIALLGNLAQEIRDNAADPEALNALADQLDADGTALAVAVAENTPAAEQPPPSE